MATMKMQRECSGSSRATYMSLSHPLAKSTHSPSSPKLWKLPDIVGRRPLRTCWRTPSLGVGTVGFTWGTAHKRIWPSERSNLTEKSLKVCWLRKLDMRYVQAATRPELLVI